MTKRAGISPYVPSFLASMNLAQHSHGLTNELTYGKLAHGNVTKGYPYTPLTDEKQSPNTKNEHRDKEHDDVIFVLNPCIPGRQFNLYTITDMTFNSEDWKQICKPNSKQMIWYSNHSYHLLSKIPHPTRRR